MSKSVQRAYLLLRVSLYMALVLVASLLVLTVTILLPLVAAPVLLIWMYRKRERAGHETAPDLEAPEQTRLRQVEAQATALLAEGKRLLPKIVEGETYDLGALDTVLDRSRKARDLVAGEDLAPLRRAALLQLGHAWFKARKAPGYEPARCVRKAARAFKQCLASLGDRSGLVAASVLRELGICHFISGRQWRPRDLEPALACFTAAAEEYRWIPYEYALTQFWLGATFLYRTEGPRDLNLERAIRCFRQCRHPRLPATVVREIGPLLDRAVRDLWQTGATLVVDQHAADPEALATKLFPAAIAPAPAGRPWRRGSPRVLLLTLSSSSALGVATWLAFPRQPLAWGAALTVGWLVNMLVIPKAPETFEIMFFSAGAIPGLFSEILRLVREPWLADALVSLAVGSSSGPEASVEIRKTMGRLDRRRFQFLTLLLSQVQGRLLCAFPAAEAGESVEEAILLLHSCETGLRRRSLQLLRIFHQAALARAYLAKATLCRLPGDAAKAAKDSQDAIRILTGEVLPFLEYFPATVTWLARKRTLVLLAVAYRQHGAATDYAEDFARARDCYGEALRLAKPRWLALVQRLSLSVVDRLEDRSGRGADKVVQRVQQLVSVWPLLVDAAALKGLAESKSSRERPGQTESPAERSAWLLAALRNLRQAGELLRSSLDLSFVNVRRQQLEISFELAKLSLLFASNPKDSRAMLHSVVWDAMREGFSEIASDGLVVLGCRLHDEGEHVTAVCALSAVIAAADRARWQILSLGRRDELLRQNAEPFDKLVLSALETGRLAQAVELSERSRCRGLTDLLTLRGVLPHGLTSPDLQRFQQAMLEARIQEQRIRAAEMSADRANWESDLYKVREDLHDLLLSIQESDPDFLSAARPLGIREIQELSASSGSALLLLRFTVKGSCAFLVYPDGTLDAFHTRSFTLATLDSLMLPAREARTPRGWFDCLRGSHTEEGQRRWRETMDRVLGELSHHLVAPVHEKLLSKQAECAEPFRLVIVPNRGASILPLHACFRVVEGGRRYLLDDFTIRYAPSLRVLERCLAREACQRDGTRDLFAIGNPQSGDDDLELPLAEWECEAVGTLAAKATLRSGNAATLEEVRELSGSAACVHFACHANYSMHSPLDSALKLAQGDSLSLGEILTDFKLSRASLVALSACETGLLDFRDLSDEHYGLATGFLCAGATTVWSTLWRVDDDSTALLMVRAYENLFQRGFGKAEALRAAQIWLRDLTNADLIRELERWEANGEQATADSLGSLRFDIERENMPRRRRFRHPHYWACFQSSGA